MLSENPVNSTIKTATISFHAFVENLSLDVATCVVSQQHMRSVCVLKAHTSSERYRGIPPSIYGKPCVGHRA